MHKGLGGVDSKMADFSVCVVWSGLFNKNGQEGYGIAINLILKHTSYPQRALCIDCNEADFCLFWIVLFQFTNIKAWCKYEW